jgi:xylulokinase
VNDESLLGIDIGTASTKAVLGTPDGQVLATAFREHGLSLPRPGWAEHDVENVWWADLVSLCRELLPAPGKLAGVCISGIGPCLAACDANLRPLRPAILYGIDTRATREIAELESLLGAEAIFERCGSMLSSQSLGPKLLWLRSHEPRIWQDMAAWHMASSYSVARLTGCWILDHHSASQCDPFYDLEHSSWAEDWVDELLPGLELPELAWPGEAVGTVHRTGEQETGIPVGTPVMAGTIDAWTEALSAGVRNRGDTMIMYGSTMFLIQIASRPRRHAKLWATAGVEPGTFSLAAGMATSGSLTGWLQTLTGGPSFGTLATEAASVPPGSDGLLILPYFAGERSPLFDPDARGVIAGLTLSHGRAHLFRGAYEAIAYGVRHNLRAFEEAGAPPARAVAVGGGTAGGLWTQIVSDVTGLAQQVPANTVGAAYGDTLLAAIGSGLVGSDTDWATQADLIEPSPASRQVYDEMFELYLRLYDETIATTHRLAEIQSRSA